MLARLFPIVGPALLLLALGHAAVAQENPLLSSAASGVFTVLTGQAKGGRQNYVSNEADKSAIFVSNGAQLVLTSPQIMTTGNASSIDASSLYGINAAVLAAKAGRIKIVDSSLATTGNGASGLFAIHPGSLIVASNLTAKTIGRASHDAEASNGGRIVLDNATLVTTGPSSAALATVGEGSVIVANGGTITTHGEASPILYAASGKVVAVALTGEARGSEAAVIDGAHALALKDSDLTGARCGLVIYPDQPGTPAKSEAQLTMISGSLTARTDAVFCITGGKVSLNTQGAKLQAFAGELLHASANSAETNVIWSASQEIMTGTIVADRGANVTLALRDASAWTGAATNIALVLNSASHWNVTADSNLKSLTLLDGATLAAIKGNGHTITYDPHERANQWLAGQTFDLMDSGTLTPSP